LAIELHSKQVTERKFLAANFELASHVLTAFGFPGHGSLSDDSFRSSFGNLLQKFLAEALAAIPSRRPK